METGTVEIPIGLLLVDIASRADFENENDRVLDVGEEHSPIADPKPIGVGGSLQTADITLIGLCKCLNTGGNPISGRSIESRDGLERSLRPLNFSTHPASWRRRRASSWDTRSPRSKSSKPSRMAARSSAVTDSSSRGAASKTERRESAPHNRRYSRNRLAARSSGSGSSSTSVWSAERVSIGGFYTSVKIWCQSILGRSLPASGAALNWLPHRSARFAPCRRAASSASCFE